MRLAIAFAENDRKLRYGRHMKGLHVVHDLAWQPQTLTGHADQEHSKKLLALGLDEVYHKPLSYEAIAALVEKYIPEITSQTRGSADSAEQHQQNERMDEFAKLRFD